MLFHALKTILRSSSQRTHSKQGIGQSKIVKTFRKSSIEGIPSKSLLYEEDPLYVFNTEDSLSKGLLYRKHIHDFCKEKPDTGFRFRGYPFEVLQTVRIFDKSFVQRISSTGILCRKDLPQDLLTRKDLQRSSVLIKIS